jgi:hypothetical protein
MCEAVSNDNAPETLQNVAPIGPAPPGRRLKGSIQLTEPSMRAPYCNVFDGPAIPIAQPETHAAGVELYRLVVDGSLGINHVGRAITGVGKVVAAIPLGSRAVQHLVVVNRQVIDLHRSQSYVGHYFRGLRTRLGTPAAIAAAAHKLARVLYHIITKRQPYDESVFAVMETRAHHRQFIRLKKQAAAFGFQLMPLACVP